MIKDVTRHAIMDQKLEIIFHVFSDSVSCSTVIYKSYKITVLSVT